MNRYEQELPDNDVDYPAHADSADMYLQERRNQKSLGELGHRLIGQIKERGVTNCGLTSESQVRQLFGQFM